MSIDSGQIKHLAEFLQLPKQQKNAIATIDPLLEAAAQYLRELPGITPAIETKSPEDTIRTIEKQLQEKEPSQSYRTSHAGLRKIKIFCELCKENLPLISENQATPFWKSDVLELSLKNYINDVKELVHQAAFETQTRLPSGRTVGGTFPSNETQQAFDNAVILATRQAQTLFREHKPVASVPAAIQTSTNTPRV